LWRIQRRKEIKDDNDDMVILRTVNSRLKRADTQIGDMSEPDTMATSHLINIRGGGSGGSLGRAFRCAPVTVPCGSQHNRREAQTAQYERGTTRRAA
jgi:hypothetical protein